MEKKLTPLLQPEESFSVLFSKMTQGAVFHDTEGRIISANPAALEILGLSEDQIYGRTSLNPDWKSIHEDGSDFPGNSHPVMIALKENKKVSNVIMGVRNSADKNYRWIKITAEPLYHNSEKLPYQILVTFDDITQQKMYSNELASINLELEDINKHMLEENSTRREIESQLRTILENMPIGIWQTDEKGDIIYGNPVARSIWQGARFVGVDKYTEYNAWWKDSGEKLRPEDWGAYQVLKSGKAVINEKLIIQCFDGTFKTILNSAVPVFDDDKKLIGAIIVNQDITEINIKDEILLDQAKKIQSDKQLLRLFVEHSPAAIAMLDKDMKYLVASKRYLKDYNLGDLDLTSRSHYEIFPEIPDRWKEIHKKCLDGHSEHCEADQFTRQDGHVEWVRWEIHPWYDLPEQVGGIIIFSEVITERVLAMEELKRAKEEAEKYEESYRQLAEAMPQIVWTADKDGNINYLNQRWNEYSGLVTDEALNWNWIDQVHPDDKKNIVTVWSDSISSKSPYEITSRIRRRDGQYRWFLIRAIPQIDQNGNVVKWFGTSTDIHEQKLLEQQLEYSNKELEQFAYVASHDLQEPLRMVTSYTKLLAKKYKGKLDENADQYISFADEGATRMHTLIKDLLMFSRITTRAKPLEKVNCSQIIEKVLMDLELLIKENNAEIIFNDLPVVIADPTQIRQLFQNLIENAIKFHHQARKPEIIISAGKIDGKWLFSIRDNGIGIESKYFERIFITFQRLHEREKYSGNGIGLAACKKIVERHGGKIWVDSEPDKGTTFYFTLP
ncbi:MAG: PAS domain S-box protein [Bacillota bacterium]